MEQKNGIVTERIGGVDSYMETRNRTGDFLH